MLPIKLVKLHWTTIGICKVTNICLMKKSQNRYLWNEKKRKQKRPTMVICCILVLQICIEVLIQNLITITAKATYYEWTSTITLLKEWCRNLSLENLSLKKGIKPACSRGPGFYFWHGKFCKTNFLLFTTVWVLWDLLQCSSVINYP